MLSDSDLDHMMNLCEQREPHYFEADVPVKFPINNEYCRKLITQAREALAVPALRAENAELRRDAERWAAVVKHLRGESFHDGESYCVGIELPHVMPPEGKLYADTADELTHCIDAAIAKGAGTCSVT